MGAGDPLRVRLTAEPQSVGQARRAVEAHLRSAGFTDDLLANVLVAVSEAATNAVVHAYRDSESPGDFSIDLDLDTDSVELRVRDQGCGPTPNPDSPGIGMGIPLMSSLSESLEITGSPGDGTEVRMSFRVP
jgi:anti-sigma regulatory factor (Ser/Thr protein kinase)